MINYDEINYSLSCLFKLVCWYFFFMEHKHKCQSPFASFHTRTVHTSEQCCQSVHYSQSALLWYHDKVSLFYPIGGIVDRTESYRLKLLHISAFAQLEPIGITIESPAVLLLAPQGKVGVSTPLQSSLHTALQSLTNSRTQALRTAVKTIYGWTIGE